MDIQQWARFAERRTFEQGEYIFREGDPGDEVMIIESGEVTITKEVDGHAPVVLGARTEGDMVGEIALLNDGPRTASVMATLPTSVFAIDSKEFQLLLREDHDFQHALLRTLIELLLRADHSRVRYATSEMHLWEQIDSLTDEQQRLSELIRLRQETINFIVHDLRNPINLALLSVSMVGEEVKSEETIKLIGMASTALRKMQRLVDSMLDVERLEGDDVTLEKTGTDMRQLIHEVQTRFTPLALQKNISFERDLPAGPLNLMVDAERIERVFSNLLDNAFKFTPNDGTITIRAYEEDDHYQFRVVDSGMGIPPQDREYVFSRFAQSDGGRGRGFGLGLAFCRSAVQAHGGTIWVEEGDEGIGTTFVFTLPA